MRHTLSAFAARGLVVAAPLALSCLACSSAPESSTQQEAESAAPPASQPLTVAWTIGGASDPALCAQSGAKAIQIAVRTADGLQNEGTFTASCEDFTTSLPLHAGYYAARAILVDSAGRPRSAEVDLGGLEVSADSASTASAAFAGPAVPPG
jgi:hypothetical protein